MKAPVFILGTQRSGTTLLTKVLSTHPKIFIKNELQVQNIFTPGVQKKDIIENIDKQIKTSFGKPIQELLWAEDKEEWGLKDPELTNYLPQLEQFIPESKFIIIVRDGRGVVNSYKHNRWGLGTNAYTGTLRWLKEVTQQLEFMNKYPDNVIMIRYEDLVTDMESSIKLACKHIGQDFTPEMLNYHNSKSHIKKTRENIHTNNKPDVQLSKKWLNELSKNEINIIETVAGDLLKKLGYNCVGHAVSLSSWKILYFNLHQRIIGEIQLQYRWRLSKIKSYLRKKTKTP